jgi:RNA polymerase-binding transcription factor DksA
MATAKKAPAQQAPATSKKAARPAPAKKADVPAKKATGPEKKTAVPTKKSAPTPAAPAKKAATAPVKTAAAAPVKKAAPVTKKAAAPATTAAPATKAAPAPVKKAAAAPVTKQAAAPAAAAVKAPAAVAAKAAPKKAAAKKLVPAAPEKVAVKGVTKDGIAYTKDFDAKFVTAMYTLLLEEKVSITGQAVRLEDEALQIIEEQEMGDVQFDDEGGEGDTMVVERERDLALSAQARQTIADIDAALERLKLGTFGYSVESGRPIPRERLEAIPWATVLVEEKVGGIGRR